jgi:predicted nucleic acid-binding protein
VKASAPNYLVDAGPLIALLNRRDQWHAWAHHALEVIAEPLWTTEAVLGEACHNLGPNSAAVHDLLSYVTSGHLRVPSGFEESAARVTELMRKYPQMDLGDATLVVLSEQFPRAKIITLDRRDFSVYRRFVREPLPLIMPV